MDTYRVDFNLAEPFPDGKKLGKIGEKNASQLIITPPAKMAENEEITHYVAAFATVKGPVRTQAIPKAEQITVALTKKMTVGETMAFQLEGIDAQGELVVKSDLLYGLTFDFSVSDCRENDEEDENEGGAAVLQNLKTVELYSAETGIYVFPDYSSIGDMHVIADYGVFPAGIEIISIELMFDSEILPKKWIDMRDMFAYAPYGLFILNYHRSFDMPDYEGICLAAAYCPKNNQNPFYKEVSLETNFLGARITYVEEGGKE